VSGFRSQARTREIKPMWHLSREKYTMSDESEFEWPIDNINLSVLIEGPAWGDANFYGEWLLAVAKAEYFWRQARADQVFKRQVHRLCDCVIHDFGISAMWLLMRLREDKTRFVLPVHRDEEGEAFAMMTGMGFFVKKQQSYQMTLPSGLTMEKVRAALLEFAETEDEYHELHVEHLVTAMPFAEATVLHNKLLAQDKGKQLH
jgi:hypothetical protein